MIVVPRKLARKDSRDWTGDVAEMRARSRQMLPKAVQTSDEAGGAAGLALAGQVSRNWAVFCATGIPASIKTFRPALVAAIPNPDCRPGARHPRCARRGAGLAGASRTDDQLRATQAGQREEHGRGLVQPQPACRDAIRRWRDRA